jgi:hypothetical protein
MAPGTTTKKNDGGTAISSHFFSAHKSRNVQITATMRRSRSCPERGCRSKYFRDRGLTCFFSETQNPTSSVEIIQAALTWRLPVSRCRFAGRYASTLVYYGYGYEMGYGRVESASVSNDGAHVGAKRDLLNTCCPHACGHMT